MSTYGKADRFRSFMWALMAFLAIGVAGYAGMNLAAPAMRSEFVQNLFSESSTATFIHLFGGALAIVIGALQLNTSFRNKSMALHRQLGRLYVVAILASGSAGMLLAINATGGLLAQSGFGLLAVAWLGSTVTAFALIRKRQVVAHSQWMIRSYAITLAGVTLRLYLGLSIALGFSFNEAYPFLAWLCWVPNVIAAEFYLYLQSSDNQRGQTTVAG